MKNSMVAIVLAVLVTISASSAQASYGERRGNRVEVPHVENHIEPTRTPGVVRTVRTELKHAEVPHVERQYVAPRTPERVSVRTNVYKIDRRG